MAHLRRFLALAGLSALLAGCGRPAGDAAPAAGPAATPVTSATPAPVGRCDGLPVDRFDEYCVGAPPPHPWQAATSGAGARLLLDAAAESPLVGNRITGKGVLLQTAAAGEQAALSCRFPAAPAGRFYLGFDASGAGAGLACTLSATAGEVLTLRLDADGLATLAAPGRPAVQGRVGKGGWVHLGLTIAADGAVSLCAVQGRHDATPVELLTATLATPVQPSGLRFAVAGGQGRWLLDNVCSAGEVGADRRGLWPFDQRPLAELRAAPRKVYCYYYPIYAGGLDAGDPGLSWYQRIRLNPTWAAERKPDRAEAGAELLYTPLPQPPLPPGTGKEQAMARCAEAEVALAAGLGLDGFLLDFHAYPVKEGGVAFFQSRSFAILDAAARVDPGFRILPAVYSDAPQNGANGEADAGCSAERYAASPDLRRVLNHPAALRLGDGRVALSMWLSERHSPAWWKEVLATLERDGIRVAFIPQFNTYGRLAEFAPLAAGMSHWGPRTPAPWKWLKDVRALSSTAAAIQTICFQDVRTRGATYWESQAGAAFRSMWEQAVAERADWAFIHTWSDYTEQAQAPSTAIGFALHDLNAWYIQWYKTGERPVVARDALYYVHRRQHSAAPAAHGAPWQIRPANAKPLDVVEATVLLRAPARVVVEVAGAQTVQDLPAGMSVVRAPLPPATACVPRFRVERDGMAVLAGASRHAVLGEVEYRNLLWHAGSIHGLEE
ncbi:MAG: hypothetical protein L6R48_07925 [Planctomycetes bacterium]|nr:hypothetical protein [Planctomycetota bacterium]